MPPTPNPSPTAQRIAARLSLYLGAHTARVAVNTFSLKSVGHGADALTTEDAPRLLAALRPVLRSFVGEKRCDAILKNLATEVR